MTADEVSALVEEYAIPSDLHPRVPSSDLTMNNLSVGAIAIPDAMPWRHHESNVSDPPPSGVSAEDVHRLCENVIDLRLVHLTMLYEIGLTTIWKHVGHHLAFKDGEENVAANMSEFLKFPMARGVRIGRGTALRPNEVIVQNTTPPFGGNAYSRQEAQDKAAGKRHGRVGTSGHTKKRKTAPLSMGLSEFEADGSLQGDSGTIHSVTPINTFNPVNTNAEAEGSNQALQYNGRVKEKAADASNNNDNNTEEVNSPHSASSPHSKRSLHSEHSLHSEEHTEIRTPNDDVHLNERYDNVQHAATCTEGANLQTQLSPPAPLNSLVEALRTRATLSEDHKALQQVHLECVDKEDALAEKLVRLTIDLSQAEAVRYNYVRQLLPTVIYRLLSIDEYKKSLYEPFNRSIIVGWAEGVKVDQTKEEARAILADADDYD
ncbi:hypothetical protein Tco_1273050 [Tanacetum coccineum]